MIAALDVWPIEYSGPLVRIDKHDLPDLDDVLLETIEVLGNDLRWEWAEDDVTRITYAEMREARVGYYRKNPCACGDGHTFDLGEVPMDDDGNPIGKAARGAFMGVYFA